MTADLTSLYADITAAGPRVHHDNRFDVKRTMAGYERREAFRRAYAYAVPSEEAINRILAFADSPIVEIAAGRGLWAHLLQLSGGSVRATDVAAEGSAMLSTNHYAHLREGHTWTHVERLDAVIAARTAIEPTLLTVWPAYADSWTSEALKAFGGARVVYVGEGHGGCTADDAFHEELDAKWELDSEVEIPQWDGLHDSVYLYRRK